ncbi:MAG: malate dehydrogenase, partial [Bacteroidales bacterium]|nr:malate dehydrogenase [Bacteroidales bacterium]
LLGTSAWMAPGASAASVVDAIINDQKKMIPCSAYLDGEYGCKDIYMGVPCIIGKRGIEKIVKLRMTNKEKELFAASYAAVAKTTGILKEINAL